MHKILVAFTGTVATVLAKKIITAYKSHGYAVDIIITEKAKSFYDFNEIKEDVTIYTDSDEWRTSVWKKDDPVLHIKLRDEYQALIITTCSLNTLTKINYGICDNLLTCVAAAWLWYKPFIIVPAMNTEMWDNHGSKATFAFKTLKSNHILIPPQVKMLACGQYGNGALADITTIVKETTASLMWRFPLNKCYGLPVTPHPGAFGFDRKGSRHTGMDLYTDEGEKVKACESGIVVGIEHFTGEWDQSPWWNNTDCLLVKGSSGVIVYGEIIVDENINIGSHISCGQFIGEVKRVIKEGREHYEIPGWRPSMLHIELYPHHIKHASHGFEDFIMDPTSRILNSFGVIANTVTYDKYIK